MSASCVCLEAGAAAASDPLALAAHHARIEQPRIGLELRGRRLLRADPHLGGARAVERAPAGAVHGRIHDVRRGDVRRQRQQADALLAAGPAGAREAEEVGVVRRDGEEEVQADDGEDDHGGEEGDGRALEPALAGLVGGEEREELGELGLAGELLAREAAGGPGGVAREDGEEGGEGEVGGGAVAVETDVRGFVLR